MRIWRLKDGKSIYTLDILPTIRGDRCELSFMDVAFVCTFHPDPKHPLPSDTPYKLDWHMSGRYLAVPVGRAVHVYERDSWRKDFVLGGEEGHNQVGA